MNFIIKTGITIAMLGMLCVIIAIRKGNMR